MQKKRQSKQSSKKLVYPPSTYDSTEEHKFSGEDISWGDESGEFEALYAMNPLRLSFLMDGYREFVIQDPNQSMVLDIGCGGGIASIPMARIFGHVLGIDKAESGIKVAQEKAAAFGLSNVTHMLGAPEEIVTSHKNAFDVITAFEVLEHVSSISLFIETVAKLLKTGGIFCISTINKTIRSYFKAILIAEYVMKIATPGTHDFGKFVRHDELSKLIEGHGIKPKLIRGLSYNPFFKRWSYISSLDTNYIMLGVKE